MMFKMFCACALLAGAAMSSNGATLYGSDGAGKLFTVNTTTGAGTFVGAIPDSTEIEFDNISGRAWTQFPNGAFQIQQFDINTGAVIGSPISDGGSYTGLEFIGSTLYGTVITAPLAPSSLRILNPFTGASTLVGLTGVGPISGLAYNGIMYGIAGGPGPANLYTLNLATGAATLIGSTGIQAGSLEFGPDGSLFAGTTGPMGGRLYRINPLTGASTFVGATGFADVTGLTLVNVVNAIPEPSTLLLFGAGLFSLVGLKRRFAGKSISELR